MDAALNEQSVTTEQEDFLDYLHASIAETLRVPESEILIKLNKHKYHDAGAPDVTNGDLTEVFNIMRELNLAGVSNPSLGRGHNGGLSLREALQQTVRELATRCDPGAYHYVELGPEPIKTALILEGLADLAAPPASYLGIDINPASRPVMREAVARYVPAGSLRQVVDDYERLERLPLPWDRKPALVTMLGFQEGNEPPSDMTDWYRRLLRPGDMLLCEMQLVPQSDWSPIYCFYNDDLMRRFSRKTLTAKFGDVKSEYGVTVVAMPPGYPAKGIVVMTTERIVDGGPFNGKIVVTNYCTKYPADEFRTLREANGAFEVLCQTVTGDGSIAFQLARRR
ncbi:L-histidine N(alpha)-methyltransferase [Arhodomonas sp. AD133]|uniref:L-histidine N(alpha)-methyltransferase n=1 Tax=Arhodomonas sp. AD133 TaxID=3415009 RepID=UPI003EBD318E